MFSKRSLLKQYRPYFSQIVGLVFITFVLDLICQGIEVLTPLLSKLVFDVALPQRDKVAFFAAIAGYFVFEMALLVIGNVSRWLDSLIAQLMFRRIKVRVIESIQTMNFLDFRAQTVGELLTVLETDSTRVSSFLVFWLPGMILNVMKLVVISGIGYMTSPWTLLVLLAMIPFYFFELKTFNGPILKTENESLVAQEDLSESLQIWLTNQDYYRVNFRKNFSISRIIQRLNRSFLLSRRAELLGAISVGSSSVGVFGLKLVVASGLGLGVISHKISVGEFVALELLFVQVGGPLRAILEKIRSARVSFLSLARVQRLTDLKREPTGPSERASSDELTGELGLEVRDLVLSFDGIIEIFKPVSFTCGPGRPVAVVGPSGVGKSSLVYSLLGLYPATRGSIRYGKKLLGEWYLENLRSQIAWISQSPLIPRVTLREYLSQESGETDDSVVDALRIVGLRAWFERLGSGLETVLGGEVSPSGGEKQRLALAKAIVRKSRVFIFDEPTASLDEASARQIKDILFEISRGASLLVVTHDKEWVSEFKEVCFLQGNQT